MLPNIKNIQAPRLTVGKQVVQICRIATRFWSIMIEENGIHVKHRFYQSIQEPNKEAGFEPQLNLYEWREIPTRQIEEQVINY